MKIGAVQLTAVPGRRDLNLARAERAIRELAAQGAGLVVLPELFSNGYAFEPEFAEPVSGTTVQTLVQLARSCRTTIVTALHIRDEAGIYRDRALIIGPDGPLAEADKSYLWGQEVGSLVPGDWKGAIADTPAGVVGVAVCYEAGFPEMVRDLAVRGAQIIAVPAAFGRPRLHAWELMTRSRALENGCILVAAGLTGDNGRGNEFAGHSRVVGPRGEVLSGIDRGEGTVLCEVRTSTTSSRHAPRSPTCDHWSCAAPTTAAHGFRARLSTAPMHTNRRGAEEHPHDRL
ncbi:carbon-nitrogen hydrolase family protein [Mycolicibacterium vaccae]|nr:carbon-nitrogen hydrolase family protein [Mycolicibacterium vaccae]